MFMTIRYLVTAALFGSLVLAQAPQTRPRTNVRPAEAKTSTKAVTVDDVKSMMEAGVSEDVIILKLRTANNRYDLTPGEIVTLKKLGASSTLLQVMLDPAVTPAAPALPKRAEEPTPAVSLPAPIASSVTNPEISASNGAKKPDASNPTNPDSAHEPGIYFLRTGSPGPQTLIPLKRATMSNTRQKGV